MDDSLGGLEQRISTRTTASHNRHINSMPIEILVHIFSHYCDFDYGPVLLLFVCRWWHRVVSEFPSLWSTCRYNSDVSVATVYSVSKEIRAITLRCFEWDDMERAAKRAGTAAMSLAFDIRHRHDLFGYRSLQNIVSLSRCRILRLQIYEPNPSIIAFLHTLPALEELSLFSVGWINGAPWTVPGLILENIEVRSRHLRYLSIAGDFPPSLAKRQKLLERITQLRVLTRIPKEFIEDFISGLTNLENLR